MRSIAVILIVLLTAGLSGEIKILFQDDFDDNSQSWATGTDENRSLVIENGSYNFSHTRDESDWVSWNYVEIDEKYDFSIRTSITHISGVDDRGYGIVWGMKDVSNYLCFDISENGYYRFCKSENDNWIDLIPWTEDILTIYPNEMENILEIRKNSDKYDFYINNFYITSYDYQPLYGDRIGYHMYRRQKIAVNDLTVAQIPFYLDIKDSDLVYFNNFSESGVWLEKNDEQVRLEIADGMYILDHKRQEGGWFTWLRESGLDENRDFSIKAEIKKLSGGEYDEYGLTWGLEDVDNCLIMTFSADGFYSTGKYLNGEFTPFIEYGMTNAIKPDSETNVVEIRKIGDFYEYYLNETLVNYSDFHDFCGDNFGFFVYGDSEIGIDYVSIEHLSEDFATRKVDLTRSRLGKHFSAPVEKDGCIFVVFEKPVENFDLGSNRMLFNMVMMGFLGAANDAEKYQALCVQVTRNDGQTRKFTVINNIMQEFHNDLISKEEIIEKIIVE